MIHIGTDRNGENHASGKISSVRIGHRLPIEYTQSLVHQTDSTGPDISTVNEVTRFLARTTEPRMSTSVMSFLDFVDGEPVIYSSDSNATLAVGDVDNFGAQADERSVVGARIMVSNVESGEPTRFYVDNPKIEVSDITYHVDPGSGWQQVYDFPSDNISSMLFSEHTGTNEVKVKIASTNSADWFKSAMVKPIYRTEIESPDAPPAVTFVYANSKTTMTANGEYDIVIFNGTSYVINGAIIGYAGADPDNKAVITVDGPTTAEFSDDLTLGDYSYQVFYPSGEYSSPAQI